MIVCTWVELDPGGKEDRQVVYNITCLTFTDLRLPDSCEVFVSSDSIRHGRGKHRQGPVETVNKQSIIFLSKLKS